MTSDRRLRIGGWAALLVAALEPLQLVVVFLNAAQPRPFATTAYFLVQVARAAAVLVAVIGLDELFRSIAPRPARIVFVVGLIGSWIGIAINALAVGGIDPDGFAAPTFLAANILLAAWFLGGGGILLRQGGGLARIGWTSQVGGLGMILTAIAVAIPFAGSAGISGHSLIDWYQIFGLFAIIYLVRVWFYVVRGRLPGPGIL